jgi:ABC-type nickel/cobalt efflux system permease component RcnA
VVLVSTGSMSKKRMYTVVSRGETATYDFIRNSWEKNDGISISSGDESTLWGKVKQLVTVGFTRINLEKIFLSSGNTKLMILFLLVAILIGAFHALSPGHGKALIGAYIIGTKGTIKDAVTLGVVTALSHTLSVLILGVVLLLVFDAVVPPTVIAYIKVASGALILIIGVILFRQRWHVLTAHHKAEYGNIDSHSHNHDHGHGHLHHNHTHEKHDRFCNNSSTGHSHDHHHVTMESIRKNGFCTNVLMGISGGMVPCPTALVVLFLAVSLQKLVMGILLILFFSLGLAVTLTILGILFAKGSNLIEKYDDNGIVSRLPTVSAGIIIIVGLVILVRAVVEA